MRRAIFLGKIISSTVAESKCKKKNQSTLSIIIISDDRPSFDRKALILRCYSSKPSVLKYEVIERMEAVSYDLFKLIGAFLFGMASS